MLQIAQLILAVLSPFLLLLEFEFIQGDNRRRTIDACDGGCRHGSMIRMLKSVRLRLPGQRKDFVKQAFMRSRAALPSS
jgi:hypothetical protein